MDKRETARFLNALYQDGEDFEVAYIQPDGPVGRKTRTFHQDGNEDLLDEMRRAEEAGFNVYTSVLPRELQTSKTYDRIWVDQDDPTAPWPFGADSEWSQPAWPKPNTLVKTSDAEGSGFRWQAIWLLSEELEEDDARDTMRRLAKQSGADQSVHDPRRVLRVPGILNVKRGSMARLIDTASDRVDIGYFNLPEVTEVDRLMAMEVNNPNHVLGEWLQGPPDGDRARKAYVTARMLKGCGVTFDDAASILKLGAVRAKPPLEDHELMHALKSAYHSS